MANGGLSSATGSTGGPRAAPVQQNASHSDAVSSKRDLTSWWRNFKKSDKKPAETQHVSQGIFGVPLQTSIRYANVAISLFDDEGQSYIYGYVPIVVAKCGVFLKEKATDVEGIFRLSGSERRIKDLKIAFDSPDRYGKGLDWTGYTVHDAANILRRYFNQLPEPIIPLDFYERFRDPLKNHQAEAVGEIDAQSPSHGGFEHSAAIKVYQGLITELPPLNRQLLLYILDLLAVFASKSDLNKMTNPNLAAIFQPGLLSHPQHDMAPQEYRLSQDVIIFLIENQDSFLIGMPGTAADTQTVRDVQSGTPVKGPTTPTTPGRSRTIIGRSSSNATSGSGSIGAESVRKFGSLRRNVSASSRHSKKSQYETGPVPVSTTTPSSSVHRSNTVPSRRPGGNAPSPRFSSDKSSSPPASRATPPVLDATPEIEPQSSIQNTPVATQGGFFPQQLQPPQVQSASSSEGTTPINASETGSTTATVQDFNTPKKDTTPLLAPPGAYPEQRERTSPGAPSAASLLGGWNVFKQSPTSGDEGQRKPNKLQKKRGPGSAISSAHSSSHSLPGNDGSFEQAPSSPSFNGNATGEKYEHMMRTDLPVHPAAAFGQSISYTIASQQPVPQRMPTDATLKPAVSPTQSYTSHTDITDISDADMGGDETPVQSSEQPAREKRKHRWRFSKTQNKLEQGPQSPPQNPYNRRHDTQAASRSTIESSAGESAQPRRSFQAAFIPDQSGTDPSAGLPPSAVTPYPASTDPVFSDSERERRGPVSWIRGKLQDRKDKEAERRARTPDRTRDRNESKADLQPPPNFAARGLSFDQSRHPSQVSQASLSQIAASRHGSAAAAASIPHHPEPTAPVAPLSTAPHPVMPISQHQSAGSRPTSSNGQDIELGGALSQRQSTQTTILAVNEPTVTLDVPKEVSGGGVFSEGVPKVEEPSGGDAHPQGQHQELPTSGQ